MSRKKRDKPIEGRPAAPTQRQRWLRYGTNVGVLVIATLAIVVMANWIGYRHYARADWSAGGQGSLSRQTLNVLDRLEGDVQLTTLYAERTAPPELLQRVRDLAEEYRRRGRGQVTLRRIDPTVDTERFRAFAEELLGRYADDLERDRRAVEQARVAFEDIRRFADRQAQELGEMIPLLSDADPDTMLVLTELSRIFRQLDGLLRQVEERLDPLLAEELPDFAEARDRASEPLDYVANRLLAPALERINAQLDDPATPAAAEEALLRLRRDYRRKSEELGELLDRLGRIGDGGYQQLLRRIRGGNSLVVTVDRPAPSRAADDDRPATMEEHGIVVLTLDEIYPDLTMAALTGEGAGGERYRGEEMITGAILRLTHEHDTKVVFLNPYPHSVLDPRGPAPAHSNYSRVAEHLRKMNFEVVEWQPGGAMGPGGQVMRPDPRPTAPPGGQMIFITIPPPPQTPQTAMNPAGPLAASALTEHLEAGRPALVTLAPSALGPLASVDPMLEPLADFYITPNLSQIVLREVVRRDGQPAAINQIEIDDWPTGSGHPVANAMRGLRGLVLQGVPLKMPARAPEGVSQWPLLVTPADTWAETDLEDLQHAQRAEGDPRGPITLAAAAERDGTRLVVIGDRFWPTDHVTQVGLPFYVQYPANTELFLNSVYWLARLEDLVAPGAMTQDVRRIGAIDRGAQVAVAWIVLLGLPVTTLLAGGAVWLTRRG